MHTTTASPAQKPRSNKAICFRCQFIGIGVGESRCPVCAYPLIVNTSPVALGSSDIERYFARPPSSPPLPGLSEEPRQAQLLAERRARRVARLRESKRLAEVRKRKDSRRRIVTELLAASCFVAGLLVTLNVLGAL